jgi:non-ribosomal peptide synthetase component F
LRISGRLRLAAVEQAFGEVIRRHEVLRSVFPASAEGEPRQVVRASSRPSAGCAEVGGLGRDRGREAARELGRSCARRPFDLAEGPLVRLDVVRRSPEDHMVVLCLHHIVADGWSFNVLQRELLQLYTSFSSGRPSPLPALPAQYRDFVFREREQLRSGQLDGQVEHWKSRLGGASGRDLPRLGERDSAVADWRGDRVVVELDDPLTKAVERFGRERGSSLFMTLLAAFDVLLWWTSGRPEVAVGAPVLRRDRQELQGLVGFFVNTVVLRSRLDDDLTFHELVSRVREEALAAFANSAVPFERVVGALGVERDLARNPLFQAWLVLQDEIVPVDVPPGLEVEEEDLGQEIVRHDLKLDLTRTDRGLEGWLSSRRSLFDPATVRAMGRGLRLLLERGVEEPDVPLGRLVEALDRTARHERKTRKERFKSSLRSRLGRVSSRGAATDRTTGKGEA